MNPDQEQAILEQLNDINKSLQSMAAMATYAMEQQKEDRERWEQSQKEPKTAMESFKESMESTELLVLQEFYASQAKSIIMKAEAGTYTIDEGTEKLQKLKKTIMEKAEKLNEQES